jgi:hypothetical protein
MDAAYLRNAEHVGEYGIKLGMKKNPRLFHEDGTLNRTAETHINPTETEFFEDNEKSLRYLSKCGLVRNGQLIGRFQLPGLKFSSARGNFESRMKAIDLRAELGYEINSSVDNEIDITVGIQENKNQHNGDDLPVALRRLIEYARDAKYKIVMDHLNELEAEAEAEVEEETEAEEAEESSTESATESSTESATESSTESAAEPSTESSTESATESAAESVTETEVEEAYTPPADVTPIVVNRENTTAQTITVSEGNGLLQHWFRSNQHVEELNEVLEKLLIDYTDRIGRAQVSVFIQNMNFISKYNTVMGLIQLRYDGNNTVEMLYGSYIYTKYNMHFV